MRTIIYYFTGTGNSLAAAKKIAAALGDTGLVPIASLRDAAGRVKPDADRVGIVSPVYDAGLPVLVKEFAERLDISAVPYTFAVVTMGGMGVSALHMLDRILLQSSRKMPDAGFAIRMPGNFPPLSRPPMGAKKEKILRDADEVIASIAVAIRKGETVRPGFSPVSSAMQAVLYPPFAGHVHEIDRNFSAGENCTSCGTCEKVCPVGNIVLENGRPLWQHRCELCCACLHFCPVEAIQLKMMRGTTGRGRYRHPGLSIEDMKAQRGEKSAPVPEGVSYHE